MDLPPPHHLRGEEVRDLLQAEQDAADRSTKGHGHASSASSTQDTAPLALEQVNATIDRDYTECAPSFVSYLLKNRLTMLPTQEAMCTNGPSLPAQTEVLAPLCRRAQLAHTE